MAHKKQTPRSYKTTILVQMQTAAHNEPHRFKEAAK